MVELFKLTQTYSLFEYYLKFMALANRSVGLNDEVVLNCFVRGFQKEIRGDVVAMAHPTLLRTVALARIFEERHTPVSKASSSITPINNPQSQLMLLTPIIPLILCPNPLLPIPLQDYYPLPRGPSLHF